MMIMKKTYLGIEIEDLFWPKRALESALTSARSCQVLLELIE